MPYLTHSPTHPTTHKTIRTAFRSTACLILALALALNITACDADVNLGNTSATSSASNAIGVIDLDQVAKELGRTAQWQAELQSAQQQATQQLQNLDRAYKNQLEAKQKEFGPNATPAQQQELRQLLANARQRLQRDSAAAEQQFANLRVSLITNFRDELAPFIREIASDRSLAVVLQKNTDLILFQKDTIEITEPLINKLIAAGLKASSATDSNTSAAPPAPTPAPAESPAP